MIVNVRESKARLSELLATARKGEEVLITVRGHPEARIVPVHREEKTPDLKLWADELRARMQGVQPTSAASSREIIDDLRGDR